MANTKNRITICRNEGRIAFGTWVQTASPEIVEAAGYQGFDFVIIDMEHGHFSLETALHMVRAAEAADIMPVVRVATNEESGILKVLDTGAAGILVPGISTKDQALRAVKAAKYAPQGTRGACPWTRATRYNVSDWGEHARRSNQESLVWLLVEGTEGVANFDEILTVAGVDAIMLGPFDLSQSLGIPGQLDHPVLQEVLQTMIRKARTAGVDIIAVMLSELESEDIAASTQKWRALGCRIMTVGGDRAIIANGFRTMLASARQAAR